MPSATTAASRDSSAQSSAIVTAGENICCMSCQLTFGTCGAGSEFGTPPKRLPIVSTGKLKNCTATVIKSIATSGAGTRCVTRGHNTINATESAPTPSAYGLKLSACPL